MELNITKLANSGAKNSTEFLTAVDSKLLMDIKESHSTENLEWIEMIEFTIPHIDKAFSKQIKQIVVEEEIVKIESIKKVSVESVKHLTKNVNFVEKYDEKNGDVTPNKILNIYKEETFLTYENRFLYTLMGLIDDFIFLREKQANGDFKGKDYRKATYQAEAKLKKEKVRINFDYSAELSQDAEKTDDISKRIKELRKSLETIKSKELFKLLEEQDATLVKPPLKMTNVLLKNVDFGYCVKLWNYLREHLENESKYQKVNKQYEEKGISKSLIDEDIYLMHLIFKNQQEQQRRNEKKKNAVVDKKTQKELTDALIEKIIDLNPELTDKELRQLIADKIAIMKARKIISLKPIEDRFRNTIDKYMNQVKEMRLK